MKVVYRKNSRIFLNDENLMVCLLLLVFIQLVTINIRFLLCILWLEIVLLVIFNHYGSLINITLAKKSVRDA